MAKAAKRRAPAGRRAASDRPARAAAATARYRAKIRMYRHGLGDCFLVRLPRGGASGSARDYSILIDCGVALGTAGAPDLMTRVVKDVVATAGGEIDLLVATHEHWDHLSGFVQAADSFERLEVGQVWLPWTEDPDDELARRLAGERNAALAALRLSASRMQLAGDLEAAEEIGGLLDFFGAARGLSTGDALAAVRRKAGAPRYCLPQDGPVEIPGLGVRLYVLGPPRDEKLIRRSTPSKRDPETYGLAMFLDRVAPSLGADAPSSPFGTLFAIPMAVAAEMEFFKRHYSGRGADDEAWRRIDGAWLSEASELALKLDGDTNNTSLVLAIELADGDVLLFAADAQVGNWLSWQGLEWPVGGRTVTGPDLLRRTIVYKVGHHGSHNATLRELGLETMDRLALAMIPVVRKTALARKWSNLPLPALVDALSRKTKGAVLQSDEPAPGAARGVEETDLYFEVTV